MPSVSIIIPLHNRAAELPQTLESIRAQTSGDWEAIIVDDHSTDGAKEVAESYAMRDARFRVIDLPDSTRGAPAGRNLGIIESRGEFIIFLDSDDLLAPTCVEHRVKFMREHPDLDFAVWRCQLFREQPGDVPQLWNADTGEDDLDRLLKNDVPWQTTGPIWRREALAKLQILPGATGKYPYPCSSPNQGTDESTHPWHPESKAPQIWDESVLSGQDWEFHIRAVASGLKYARVAEVDCHWRLAGPTRESIGKSSFGKQHALARLDTLNHIERFLFDKSDRYLKLLPRLSANYLSATNAIADSISRKLARSKWPPPVPVGLSMKFKQRRQFSRYLFWKRSPAKAKKLWNQIKLTWPRELLPTRGKFFNVAPVDPDRAPRVSVVMSAYNNADYIEAAVNSILWQSFRDFEFIIIDDGSTDGTGELLKQLADTDCRIKLVSRENKGLTVSLNEGLALARGKYIARMDSDDLAIRERFEKQVAYLDAHPDCVLVGTKVMLIDPLDVEIVEGEFHQGHENLDAALLKGNGASVYHPSVMMRKTALDRVGGYVPRYNGAEDVELFLRLAEIGTLENLPDILLHYRKHPASVNHTKHEKQYGLVTDVVNEARARRGLAPIGAGEIRKWTPEPVDAQLRTFGWNAMKRKRIDIARSHAWQAVKMKPFSLDNLRLLCCAIRGR